MGDWVPIDELIAYRWDQAELRLLNKSPDHDEMRRRCWLRRLMWNLRHNRRTNKCETK